MDIAVLRNENERLKEQLARTQATLADSEEARQRLETIIVDMRREKFGAKSEKLRPDQFHLPLEDVRRSAVDRCAHMRSAIGFRWKQARPVQLPNASRLCTNTSPVRSQTRIFTRSARFARNTKAAPLNGSSPNIC